jgi:hypothetical protein
VECKRVKQLGDKAFDQCSKLVSINLKNVEIVYDKVFAHCYSINNLNLSSVKQFQTGSFNIENSAKNLRRV